MLSCIISTYRENDFVLDKCKICWPIIKFEFNVSDLIKIRSWLKFLLWRYIFTVFRLLTDFVCLYNYEFGLSLCKIVRSSVILLLPLLTCNDIPYEIGVVVVVVVIVW